MNRPAGFWIRLGAIILDGLILAIVFIPLAIVLGFNSDQSEVFQSLVELVYSILLPVTWVGYTIGKRICGVRIVKVNGENVGIGTMLLREVVGRLVYILTLGIGIIVSAFMVGLRQDKRAIHDLIAGTYVTYEAPEETNPY
nr:RDD family protein [Bacillus sp. FJAT-45350]